MRWWELGRGWVVNSVCLQEGSEVVGARERMGGQ